MLWLGILTGMVLVLILTSTLGYRWLARRREVPCPSWLWWVVDNPLRRRGVSRFMARLELSAGMRVLDAGCGPGRLSVPMARAVGPTGSVLAVDLQSAMLRRTRHRAEAAGLSNIRFLQAGIGDGKLPAGAFDRAVLVTVLGEIVDRPAALREIHSALKPGGLLSVTEVLPDPHYQSMRTVRDLATRAGFRAARTFGNVFVFTMQLQRP